MWGARVQREHPSLGKLKNRRGKGFGRLSVEGKRNRKKGNEKKWSLADARETKKACGKEGAGVYIKGAR